MLDVAPERVGQALAAPLIGLRVLHEAKSGGDQHQNPPVAEVDDATPATLAARR